MDKVTKIPESRLPEPFNQETCNLTFNIGRADIAAEPSSTSNEIVDPLKNIHVTNLAAELSSTSNEIVEPLKNLHLNAADLVKQVQSFSSSENSLSSDESDSLDDQESESAWQKECTPLSDCERNLNAESGKQKESLSMSFQENIINTPSEHKIPSSRSVSHCISESPDLKIISCADSLLTQTPALSAPERLVLGSDVKPQKMTAQKSMSCFKPAKRALDFTQTEGNDDLDSRVDLLESSKAMHAFDCNTKLSRGSVSLPREVCLLVLVLIFK